MTLQFADRADAVDFIADRLRQVSLVSSADSIAAAIVDEWGQSVSCDAADSSHRAIFRPTRWVIRNQDLGLLDAVSGSLQGTVTGAALFASTGSLSLGLLTPAIAVATHLVKIAMNIRKKSVQLSESEFFVLALVLECHDGASLDLLHSRWTKRFGEEGVSGMESLLEHLAKYPSSVGDLSLIWKGSDGRWRAKDL